MVTYSQDPQDFLMRARRRKGIVTPVTCRRCGQLLTDPGSIAAGIGPECAGRETSEREVLTTWPLGARVRITGGTDEGRTGKIVRVMPRRPYPVRVSIDGHGYITWYPVNRLELIGGAA
jgi:hypothetical protein